jgi:sensor histidine kinase YesM
MSNAEKYLPFILATLIPALSVIINPVEQSSSEWKTFAFRYLIASSLLLIIWYSNKWLLQKNFPLKSSIGQEASILLANAVIIFFIFLLDFLMDPFELSPALPDWLLVMRFCLVALIFNVILRIFKTQKESAELKYQNLLLKAENLNFQVDLLKQQINPHFLFNSLNTLLDLVEEDAHAAGAYIRSFSSLYRAVLQSSKHDFIPLIDELRFLDDYWSLLKVRFNDAIHMKINISRDRMDDLLPPLSLQFLIENAVKHNEATRKSPLFIEIRENQGQLIVQNKINSKNYPPESERIGLMNLQERFTVLYKPIEYGIEDGHFIVRLPLRTA